MADSPVEPKLPSGLWAKKDRILVVGAIVALIIVIWAFSGGSNNAPASAMIKQPSQTKTPSVGPKQIADFRKRQDEEIRRLAEEAAKNQEEATRLEQLSQLGLANQVHAAQVTQQNAITEGRHQSYSAPARTPQVSAQTTWKSHIVPGIRIDETQKSGTPSQATATSSQPSGAASALAKAENKSLLPGPDLAFDQYVIPEGTILEAALLNKLDGSFSGPLKAQISTAVYAPGTRTMVLPQGAVFLGKSDRVADFGQSRLAITFQRIVVGVGSKTYAVDIDRTPGLDQGGATALNDKSSQHVLSSLAVAGAVGAISGLAQIGNTGISYGDPAAQFRLGITSQTSMYGTQILQRFLNRQPTVTIRPGTRIKIMTVADIRLPAYQETL